MEGENHGILLLLLIYVKEIVYVLSISKVLVNARHEQTKLGARETIFVYKLQTICINT